MLASRFEHAHGTGRLLRIWRKSLSLRCKCQTATKRFKHPIRSTVIHEKPSETTSCKSSVPFARWPRLSRATETPQRSKTGGTVINVTQQMDFHGQLVEMVNGENGRTDPSSRQELPGQTLFEQEIRFTVYFRMSVSLDLGWHEKGWYCLLGDFLILFGRLHQGFQR